jgi:hypothetical protein
MNDNVNVVIIEMNSFWYLARDYQGKEIEIKKIGPALVQSNNLANARRELMKLIVGDIDAWQKWNRGGCRITMEVM